tara:strand:+ start:199 stop:573 length:375 start_codon:yes stop_codon:yes gene_type:complete
MLNTGSSDAKVTQGSAEEKADAIEHRNLLMTTYYMAEKLCFKGFMNLFLDRIGYVHSLAGSPFSISCVKEVYVNTHAGSFLRKLVAFNLMTSVRRGIIIDKKPLADSTFSRITRKPRQSTLPKS